MQKGNIKVTTDNIFPIIKKFLYSEHEIFLRELVSNAIDATQKLKTMAARGEYNGETENLQVKVSLDKDAKTITISDNGIGMSAEEIDKYINQIAFSGAEEFLEKYKDDANSIIGHFGLGFYSSFMVSERVDIITKSFREGSQAVKWSCDGSPEYSIEDTEREEIGTDIVLHIDSESEEYLDNNKIEEILTKFCKYLPVEIVFGKETEYKDGKTVETDKDKVINNTNPLWKRTPADLKDEDYKDFYKELYPMSEDPLFNIHLNVDYPFNLTGVLYFPRIKNNVEIQKNKIQLYCNQVFVTSSVENIVPEYLTLLHGVIDSPDIPLNVSRSYLQGDPNVKKISSHISKKVAEKLKDIFKSNREDFEKKWDDLKIFIEYGMLSDDKFFDRLKPVALFKNTDGKYFTFEEYETLVKSEQTDKNDKVVYLYTTNTEEQYTYINIAKNKGYDVLELDGELDMHFIQKLEQKLENVTFARVDADIIDKLIEKKDAPESSVSENDKQDIDAIFSSQLPKSYNFTVQLEALSEADAPIVITQAEFMRRMQEMSKLGGGMNFYGEMPAYYNLVVNSNHPVISELISEKNEILGEEIAGLNEKLSELNTEKDSLEAAKKDKKDEEVPQADKDKLDEVSNEITKVSGEKTDVLSKYAGDKKIVSQLIDLALLSNNMLKGDALSKFINRSIDLIK